MTSPHAARRFEIETTDAYSATAATAFVAQPTTGGIVLVGPCPRCADPMQYPWVDDSYRGILPPTGLSALPANRRTAKMICTCSAPHEGRPDGEIGCGAYWNLSLEE